MLPDGWKKGIFSDGINLISGQHVEAQLVNSQGQGVPYLTGPADFPNGEIITTKYTQSGNAFCEKDDILITVKGSGTGKIIRSDGYYAISRQLMAVQAEKYDSNFIYFSLCHNIIRYQGAAAGLIPGIGRNDILSTLILLPPLEEQKKIAAILSTWDRAIERTGKLLANSQQQKRALMQQLLTAKKHLPGFSGKWKKCRLSDCCNVVMGSSPKSEFYNETGEGLPLLQGNADIKNRVSCPRIFTSEITKECQLGDILLSVRAPVGTVSIALHHACIGRGISSIRAKNGNSQEFAYQYFLNIEDRWNRLAQGSTFEAVNGNDIKKLTILLPPLPEQRAIAAVLTTADGEITAIESDLARLRQEKKALMQQLLTGKRRVKVD